ncbi:MAG: sigma-54 dependent transcriptional regulator [Candidatus Cloacimonetes bacterium]|nr:sigma-54 dependent transcriptional regulator [Candidatus Cloacimonadota bacterium]
MDILILEDNARTRETYEKMLHEAGWEVAATGSIADFERIHNALCPRLLLLDVDLGGGETGLDVLRRLSDESRLSAKVIVITGKASRLEAVEAVRLGAYSFIDKAQFDRQKFLIEVKNALALARSEQDSAALAEALAPTHALLGECAAMKRVRRLIEVFGAAGDAGVLTVGETGTGKEIVAGQLYHASSRRGKPFLTVNVGGMSDGMLASELFGHKKGAFTGADNDRPGYFSLAEGGTLFLDEIANLSLDAQSKILRAIQQKEIQPVGGVPRRVDVRLLFATNRDLLQLVHEGGFKDDLYYRLEGNVIHLPPLRERGADAALLLGYFLSRHGKTFNTPVEVDTAALATDLAAYDWPGNVRELENLCESLCITREAVTDDDVRSELARRMRRGRMQPAADASLQSLLDIGEMKQSVAAFERAYLLHHLEANRWNRSATADKLGLERTTLYKKMKKYGL